MKSVEFPTLYITRANGSGTRSSPMTKFKINNAKQAIISNTTTHFHTVANGRIRHTCQPTYAHPNSGSRKKTNAQSFMLQNYYFFLKFLSSSFAIYKNIRNFAVFFGTNYF